MKVYFKDGKITCKSLAAYMSQSALFAFHRKMKFRKVLIRMVVGGSDIPTFESPEKLIEFYTQEIPREFDGEEGITDPQFVLEGVPTGSEEQDDSMDSLKNLEANFGDSENDPANKEEEQFFDQDAIICIEEVRKI